MADKKEISAFDRFRMLAKALVAVPKKEAEKVSASRPRKRRVKSKKR